MSKPSTATAAGAKTHRRFGGLLVRRESWSISGRVKLLLGTLLAVVVVAVVGFGHQFLAANDPLRSEILVVEGWMPASGLRQAIGECRAGGYREVLSSGCLTHEDSGNRIGSTYADWGAERLRRFGLTSVPITAVPCYIEQRDRTYVAALAVKEWLAKNRPGVTAIDVVSFGPHARRSRLIFQKAMGDHIQVGIISVPDPQYDPEHWWRSSEGVRTFTGEALAYLYARLFFWPRPLPLSPTKDP